MKRHAPGCVLLQAALGGNSSLVGTLFDSNCWIVNGIDGLRLIPGTVDDWKKIAAMSASIWQGRRPDYDPLPRDWKDRARKGLLAAGYVPCQAKKTSTTTTA